MWDCQPGFRGLVVILVSGLVYIMIGDRRCQEGDKAYADVEGVEVREKSG